MDDSRVECELQFEMVLGAAEEPKKSERSTTSPKCIMSQQRRNNRRNEGERWRCVGQREKLHGRKTEQDNFRVVRDTVNGLFKGTFGPHNHIFRSSMSMVVWLFALLFKKHDCHGDVVLRVDPSFQRHGSQGVALFFSRTFMRKDLRMSKRSTDSKGEEGDTKVLTCGRAQARCTADVLR